MNTSVVNTYRSTALLRNCKHAALSQEDIKALVEATYSSESFRDLREIIGIVSNSGLYPADLARLWWKDIDFAGGFFTVAGADTASVRRVPLGRVVAAILRKRHSRMRDSEFVLGSRPEALLRRIAKQLRTLSERAIGRQVRLKDFAHSFYGRWIETCGNSVALAMDTLALVAGSCAVRALPRGYSPPQHSLRIAAEVMERIQM